MGLIRSAGVGAVVTRPGALAACLPACLQAGGALTRYGVHAVVANILHTRKDRVLVVQLGQQGAAEGSSTAAAASGAGAGAGMAGLAVVEIVRPPAERYIEVQLVSSVARLHHQFMGAAGAGG